MAKIAFLQSFWFEFLGPMYISSYLKKWGHEVELFMDDGKNGLDHRFWEFEPDIIGFSCSSGSHLWAEHTAAKVKAKKPDTVSVMGGPHATYFPEEIRSPHIDFLIRGEGEEAMLDLVSALENGGNPKSVKNLVYLEGDEVVVNPVRALIENLDELPSPDRSLYYKYAYLRKNPNKHVITGRGCPFNCSFCCNKSFKDLYKGLGKMVRRHSVERVIHDITQLQEEYGVTSLRFDDEVFVLAPKWLDHFLEEYRRHIHLPFSCLIRADLMNYELAKKLKNAGCYIAYFGVESGNDYLRQHLLNKRITREHIIATAHYLKKVGIKCGTFNMLGLPGETVEQAFQTVELNQQIKTDYPWCSILQPYPKTELEELGVKQGYIERQGHIDALSGSYFNRSIIKNESAAQLENLQRFFYLAVKFPLLVPLIKKLITYQPNKIFDFIFQITYAYRYMRTYRVSMLRIAFYAFRLRHHF